MPYDEGNVLNKGVGNPTGIAGPFQKKIYRMNYYSQRFVNSMAIKVSSLNIMEVVIIIAFQLL